MNRYAAFGATALVLATSCGAGAGEHAQVTATAPLPPAQVEAVAWNPPATTTTTTTAPPRRVSRQATPRPRPKPRPPGNCWGWGHLVFAYDWPHSTACAVLGCESRGDPNARNPRSSATGLFQILNGPTDPAANVALAYQMWRRRGWQPWTACL